MRLHYWQTRAPPNNFGDELNPWLWPRVLGPRVLGDDGPWLVGIGSLLGDVLPFPDGELKLVMGSGAGYGTPPALDASWRIYAVRGPRTARLLGLPLDTVATDPGRVLKYLGSALLVLGIIVMYWLRGVLVRRPAEGKAP